MNLLSISANYNDQTFSKKPTTANNTAYVYPKYFFGLTIPVGLIFSRSSDINIAKENLNIYEGRREELARSIREDVLAKYRQYKAYGDLMAIQNQIIDDEQAGFMQTEQKFKDGTISIEAYNAASKSYNAELSKRIELQLQQDLIKLQLEQAIGMRLEDAIRMAKQ